MRTVAVVGASLAGLSAARALREQSHVGRIVMVGAEQHRPYDQFAGHRSEGDVVEVVEGETDSCRFLAVYRRAGRPVAVFAMNQPRLFGQWRRQLAARPTEMVTPS